MLNAKTCFLCLSQQSEEQKSIIILVLCKHILFILTYFNGIETSLPGVAALSMKVIAPIRAGISESALRVDLRIWGISGGGVSMVQIINTLISATTYDIENMISLSYLIRSQHECAILYTLFYSIFLKPNNSIAK